MTAPKVRLTTVLLVLLLTLFMTACGAADKEAATNNSSGKSKVEVSADRAKVKVKNDEGQVIIDTKGTKLPQQWPKDVPALPKAKVVSVIEGAGDADMMMAVFQTEKNVASVKKYYEATLPENSWVIDNRVETGADRVMLMGSKNKLTVSITIVKDDDSADSILTINIVPR
jgi:hypothetical protein